MLAPPSIRAATTTARPHLPQRPTTPAPPTPPGTAGGGGSRGGVEEGEGQGGDRPRARRRPPGPPPPSDRRDGLPLRGWGGARLGAPIRPLTPPGDGPGSGTARGVEGRPDHE